MTPEIARMTIWTTVALIVGFGAGWEVHRRYGVYLDGIWGKVLAVWK